MNEPDPPNDPPVFTFFLEVGIIEQLSRTAFTRVLPDGMQISQFSMLNHMVRLGDGWSQQRLADAFQVTKGAISNTVSRLEDRGLVRTETDDADRRSKRVYITEAGREMRERCVAALMPEMQALMERLGPEPFERALPHLQAVRAFLDAARD